MQASFSFDYAVYTEKSKEAMTYPKKDELEKYHGYYATCRYYLGIRKEICTSVLIYFRDVFFQLPPHCLSKHPILLSPTIAIYGHINWHFLGTPRHSSHHLNGVTRDASTRRLGQRRQCP